MEERILTKEEYEEDLQQDINKDDYDEYGKTYECYLDELEDAGYDVSNYR